VGISIGAMQRVATENMQWAMPEVGIGFYPDVGAGYFLAKCQDFIGYYLALTGMKITADEALYCNFIDAIVPQTKFPELIAAIADTSLQKEPKKITAKIITKFALPASKNIWQQSASIKQCFQRKTIEEIIAALQQENSPWAQQTMASLLRQSPTSLKVTLQKLQNLGALNFDQCLQQDFCLSQHFANATDFYEGIRAAVIDKDRQPKWQPATLAMVRQQTVDAYFQPTPTVLQFHD
jgi:enoyl-CoA hydratase/carnithine racemase